MKKLFLSMILMALPLVVSAYDCQVDGIYYQLTSGNQAEVTYESTDYNSYSGEVVIPEKFTYNGVEYSVISIRNSAFRKSSGLTSVTIPNSVTKIGAYSFRDCSGLTSVTIPNSVTTIGGGAFSGCSGLTSVHITDLAAWCNIEFFDLGSNPLIFAHHLYVDNAEVLDLVIPEGISTIKQFVFSGCSNLTSVTIPNSVTNIGQSAFYNCSNLPSVTILNSVTSIGNSAFSGCSALTTISIPNSVSSIGENVFLGCSGLTSITIPESVTSIERSAFASCSSLTSVTIPNSVTSIGESAFSYCNNLKTVTFPEKLKIIRMGTFHDCRSLTEIVIPAKVEFIYSGAFSGCPLKSVTSLAINPPFCHDLAFSDYNIPLYVPAEAVNSYQATNPWSKFSELKTISGDPIDNKCATPTISYADKKLTFACETEGVEFVSKITDADIKDHNGSEVSLTATYNISVYATKSGYTNSDVATATLVWTDAIFTETTPETPTSAKAVQESIPVLISAKSGTITVTCEQEGQPVAVYSVDGKALGNSTVSGGQATIATPLQKGQVAIVKVGNRSVKIAM